MRGIGLAARRGGVVGAAYLATALATVAVIVVMRHFGAIDALRQVLGVQFIATLAAGLEPATSRALAIGRRAASVESADLPPIALAGATKAMVASIALAVIWRVADPSASLTLLAFSPALCLVGFLATDLRVLLDFQGRHAQAIWLKQGSLALGLLVLAALVQVGVSFPLALAAALVVRCVLVGTALFTLARGRSGRTFQAAGDLLRDPRWMNLAAASVLAAAGGSADRMFGLRFLTPQAWSSYYLVYEVFSKAWFVPYLLTPILFARAAGGQDGGVSSTLAWGLTLASGAGFLICVVVALTLAPDAAQRLIGGDIPAMAVAAFALAVAVNSAVQLRVAELQGSGRIGRAFLVTALSAVSAIVLFYLAASRGYGAAGLFYAWLIKAAVELILAFTPLPPANGVSAPA